MTPASVPPVPVAHVNPSRRPESCDHSSGPVVSMCARRLAVLSNWLVQTALSMDSGKVSGGEERGEKEGGGSTGVTLGLVVVVLRVLECHCHRVRTGVCVDYSAGGISGTLSPAGTG